MKHSERKYASAAALMLAALLACGCAAPESPAEKTPEASAVPATPEVTAPATPEAAAPAAPEADAEREEMLLAYRKALDELYENHRLPDGTDAGGDENGTGEGNVFALCDVDGDGAQELIIIYTETVTAAQTGRVYAYDGESGTLREELSASPFLSFYANGAVREDWSHNHGLGGSYWPYTLYIYDGAKDAYIAEYMVDAWEKAFAPVDSEGNPFPDAADASGKGVVFYIMHGTEYVLGEPGDSADYEAWLETVIGGAEELEPDFTVLTPENIDAMA